MTEDDILCLIETADTNRAAMLPLLKAICDSPDSLSEKIEARIVHLVPKLCEALNDPENDDWVEQSYICEALGRLGCKAQAAIPALFKHAERYPRFEHNVLAIGYIGGPGVVRRLIEWTYWSGSEYDRKRTNAACSAIRRLGNESIVALLEIAASETDDSHNRSSAILNLYNNTDYSPKLLVPIIIGELEREDCYVQCDEALSALLAQIGKDYQSDVLAAITVEKLLNQGELQLDRFVAILVAMGAPAVPTLVAALERSDQSFATRTIIAGLCNIGGPGLDYLHDLVSKSEQQSLRGQALREIPACGLRYFESLVEAIRKGDDQDCVDSFVWQAVERLGDFTDEADRVIRFLSTLLSHRDRFVAETASRCIERLRDRQRVQTDGGSSNTGGESP